MTRTIYLTARCTRGCELWGTPDAIARHVSEHQCHGLAWFRRPSNTVLIEAKYVELIESSIARHLLVDPGPAARETPSEARPHQPHAVQAGRALRSPIDGVPPRVWWLAVKPYLDADIPPDELLDLALRRDSFHNLMPDDHLDQFTTCPECGDLVAKLGPHQRSSTRCRTAAAANRVLELWQHGYRDPWTAADKPPVTWGELRVARWKHRVEVIEFPRHNAVLLASVQTGHNRPWRLAHGSQPDR